MFIDSVILYGLVRELKELLLSAQVKQIHQTDPRVIDMELYRPMSSPAHLILCAQNPPCLYAVCGGKKRQQYIDSQTFCMTLRKNLEGSRLSDIRQIQMDRIVCLSFDRIETGGEIITKNLYAELIPSAPNLILTEDGKILDVLIRNRKQHRELANQKEYVLPEGGDRLDFMQFSADELFDILHFSQQAAGSFKELLFSRFNGLSTPLVSEIARRAEISGDCPAETLSEDTLHHTAEIIYSLGQEIREASGPYVYPGSSRETVSLLPLSLPDGQHIPSISSWLAQAAGQNGNMISASVQELKKKIHNLIKKEERKEKKIQNEMEETALLEKYKLWGNLLSIYAYMKVSGRKEITVDNPFDANGGTETIPLLPEYSLIRNSQLYFKKYGRMKTRLAIGQEKLEECRIKLEYLRNAAYFAEEIRERKELLALQEELKSTGIDKYGKQERKKKQTSASADEPALYSLEGCRVWIGRNSRQNEALTLHRAGKNDLWLHAQKIPGSHVVIETGDGLPPESVIEKAASWAAWFSKGKNDKKVSVDCTRIRYVKKIKNAPPGLVSYTHQKTLAVIPEPPAEKADE